MGRVALGPNSSSPEEGLLHTMLSEPITDRRKSESSMSEDEDGVTDPDPDADLDMCFNMNDTNSSNSNAASHQLPNSEIDKVT